MKKKILAMSLLTIFTLGGSVNAVYAGPPAGRMMGEMRGCVRDDSGGGRHLAKMTQVLDLSEAQQAQISTIVAEERAKTDPLRRQMFEYRDQIAQLTQAKIFDEAAIRNLAVKKAEVGAELMVSKARTRNLIQLQLTPEQREKADSLFQDRHERRGGKGHFRNPERFSRSGNCPKDCLNGRR